jgi:hypothetical protein
MTNVGCINFNNLQYDDTIKIVDLVYFTGTTKVFKVFTRIDGLSNRSLQKALLTAYGPD